MKRPLTAAILAAGLAVLAAGADAQPRVPFSLTSFGAAQTISAYQLSAAGLVLGARQTASRDLFAGTATVLTVAYGWPDPRPSFAASRALSDHLALDAGYNLDLGERFTNFSGARTPLLADANILGLANGGRYAGLTYAPMPSLRLRLGAQWRSDRLDNFSFDPFAGTGNLPLAYDASQSRSLLAGLSWDFTDWGGLGIQGLVNSQKGTPLSINPMANLAGTRQTEGLGASAHVNFGGGWVTTASYSLTQLDQKAGPAVAAHSYSIAISKNGVFGNDALGFSYSRPNPALLNYSAATLATSGDLPPVFLADGSLSSRTPETDLQLGYVTSFWGGALALQTNASYQMNYRGQAGATSLAVLSRAKIKF